MQCSEIKEMLSAYIDEVLDEHEKAGVEEHLRACSACLQELNELKETVTLLRSLDEVSPPEGFRQQLRERLEKEAAITGTGSWRLGLRRWLTGSWKYAAAAVLILGIGISAGLYTLKSSGLHSYGLGSAPKVQSDQQVAFDPTGTRYKARENSGSENSAGLSDLERMKLLGETAGDTKSYSLDEGTSVQVEKDDGAAGTSPGDSARLSYISGQSSSVRAASSVSGEGGQDSRQNNGDVLNTPPPAPEGKGGGGTGSDQYLLAQNPGDPATAPPDRVDATDTEKAAEGSGNAPVQADNLKESQTGGAGVAEKTAGSTAGTEKNTVKAKAAPGPEQKIVRDGLLVMEVENYREFDTQLPEMVSRRGGYIENSTRNTGTATTASFVIRVPNAAFAELVQDLEPLGKVLTKQITGKDVSGEFIDVQSRQRSLQKQEQRLLGLVDKAGSVNDMVALENELGKVRNEIEILQGRLKNLDKMVVYSTIRLEVRETTISQVESAGGVFGKAARNFKNSIVTIINMLGALVSFTGWFLPWAILLTAIGGGLYYYRKKM